MCTPVTAAPGCALHHKLSADNDIMESVAVLRPSRDDLADLTMTPSVSHHYCLSGELHPPEGNHINITFYQPVLLEKIISHGLDFPSRGAFVSNFSILYAVDGNAELREYPKACSAAVLAV